MGRRTPSLLALALLIAAALAAAPAAGAFPGGNGKIAYGWFSMQEDELGIAPPRTERALRTIAPDGRSERQLRSCLLVGDVASGDCEPSLYGDPAFSPDGTRIAFDGGDRLALIDADGGGAVRILPGADADPGEPAFSPSGTRLAFDAGPTARDRQLWISDLFGGGARRLTGRAGRAPAWSTRDVIAFERDRQLWTIRPEGSALRRITGRGGRAPAWSPHGTKLAFVRGRSGLLYTCDADGGGLRRVRGPRGVQSVAWSPDGRRLAYEAFDTGILTVRLDGSGERQLVSDAVGATHLIGTDGLDWQPLR